MTQQQALDILKMGHSVFLTGAAGSGKTYVLNQYINWLKDKGIRVGITASTGIAATHIEGTTIHSWSGMGIKDELHERDIKKMLKRPYLKKRFDTTNVLIIDEVSMLHPFQLDMVDQITQAFKQSHQPFGGMQVILCGDLFQLPPITKGEQEEQFFTASNVWQTMQPHVCYLHEQYRHDDDSLTNVLNDIRSNRVEDETLQQLRTRYQAKIENDIKPTKLHAHNIDVDRINSNELAQIDRPLHTYDMWTRGSKALVDTLVKSCLAPETLELKQGTIVMFVKNGFDKGYVNGTLGTVIDFDEETEYPIVQTYNGKIIIAYPDSWSIEEDGKVKAQINQIPLRLAWAITVHKSQGMTLDAAEIDLSKSFVPSMGYVALSRVRTLDGLRLLGLNDMAMQVNEQVLVIDKELRNMAQKSVQYIEQLGAQEIIDTQKAFINKYGNKTKPKEQKPQTIVITKALLEQKKSIEAIARERNLTPETIINHIEKLIARGDELDLDHIKPDGELIGMVEAAFDEAKDTRLSPAKALLPDETSYYQIRLARLFIIQKSMREDAILL